MEPISGICYVTVSFLQNHSIYRALGRALCSCQLTRISVLYSELLSCQQGLAVNPVCLAQGDQCRFSSLCGTDFPAALNTPGPCPLILGPAWDKEAAAHPFFQQISRVFNNLKASLRFVIITMCSGARVWKMLRYLSLLAHPMVSVFSWKPSPGWGVTTSLAALSDSISLFYLCILSPLCWERGRYAFLYPQGPLKWCCISALNIKVAEVVYVAKQWSVHNSASREK